MADGCRTIERWTLRSLAGAFLELAIAYVFLCAAAVAFAAAKLFSLFGVDCLDLHRRHSPPFPLRPSPSPSRPPSCCPPHNRPLLILENNDTVSRRDSSELESESESVLVDSPGGDDQEEEIEENCCDSTIFEKLKGVMREERAARAALSRELERERSAAASAADEAMAMMLRLQEEKAAAEIEARQYRRMAEEKSAYDAAEMEALKEIVVRREREKLVLETRLEECQQTLMLINNSNDGGGNGEEAVAGIDGRVYDVHVVVDDDDQNAGHLKPSHAESGSSEPAATGEKRSCDDFSSSLPVVVADAEKLALERDTRREREAAVLVRPIGEGDAPPPADLEGDFAPARRDQEVDGGEAGEAALHALGRLAS